MDAEPATRPTPDGPGADRAGAGEDAGAEESAEFYRHLAQTLDVGIAVADPDSWSLRFENARFFELFAPDPTTSDETLLTRVPAIDSERAASRFEKGRPYTVEVEAGSGARSRSLEVKLRPCELDGRELVVVECSDVTKAKQAEHMLDSYSRMADKNARDLKREKERAEKLLLNIMPRAVYEEMKDFGSVTPQRFDEATILMLDFAGFTEMAVSRDAGSLVSELNDIFSAFDRIVELFNCERMKTIGDAYMAVAGLPEPSSDHAQSIARVALRMRRYLERRNTSHREPWLGRIGIHSGTVVGSIVGVQRYVYDIFGPGVNMAARMEQLSEPMEITISDTTHNLLRQEFICSEIGEVDVKGFGKQRLWTLDGELEDRR
ncbi:MAG TPA: adenylate/guanylate cyclase domain-containing protein [Solirubrobacterales bacterium]|nr:adenylate/guanylate cyclase domain-containing protein [Solirubrobacterales bacterium]